MSPEVATALGAAFVASVLTMIGARWIAGFQAKRAAVQDQLRRDHEREQARLADERSLRDARRERLRADYVAVAYAADTIYGVSKELGALWAGETRKKRDDRLNDLLQAATDDLRRATVRLRLEEGAKPIVDAFDRVRSLWVKYQTQVPQAEAGQDYRGVAETLRALDAEVEGIIARAKADLDALGKPI